MTDIERDGELAGPALDLYKEILRKFPALQLVASGGIRDNNDLELLAGIGCAGAIVGKAFFEGQITLEDFKRICKN